MSEHYFISDLHLGHQQVIQHDKRPFESIEEHDITILNNLTRLPKGSDLWLLGDVAFTKDSLGHLFDATAHLKVHLVRGNHDDKLAWKQRDKFHSAHEALYTRASVNGERVRLYLSHYSHRTWRNSHHGSYHLYGHSHGALCPWGRSLDVGANVIGYVPISLTAVHEQLSALPFTNHHENTDT